MVLLGLGAAALGVGGDLLQGKSAQRAAEKTLGLQLDHSGSGERKINKGYAESFAALDAAEARYDQDQLQLMSVIEDQYAFEIQRAMEEQFQASAQADQAVIDRGLFGSNVALNYQRAIREDSGERIAGIVGAGAETRAAILDGASRTRLDLGIRRSDLFRARGEAKAGFERDRVGIYGGYQTVTPPNTLQALGQFGGTAANLIQAKEDRKDLRAFTAALTGGGGQG